MSSLICLTTLKKRKSTSNRGPKLRKIISPVDADPYSEQYTKDSPGVIRPLTPPLTRHAAIVRPSHLKAVATLPRYNVTKSGAAQIRSAANAKSAIKRANPEASTDSDAYFDGCNSATSNNGKASTWPTTQPDGLQTHDIAQIAPNMRRQADSLIYHPDIGLVTEEKLEEVIASTRPKSPNDLDDNEFIDVALSLPDELPGRKSGISNTSGSDSYDTSDIEDRLLESCENVPAVRSIPGSVPLGLPIPANGNVKGEVSAECLKAQDTTIASPIDQVVYEDLLDDDSDFSITDVSSVSKAQPTQASAPHTVNPEDYDLGSDSDLANAVMETSTALSCTGTTCSSAVAPVTTPVSDIHPNQPIQRPLFPTPARDRSPIVGMHPSTMLRTHFRLGPALNTGCAAARSTNPNGIIIELYASVISSTRDLQMSTQHFVLADIYHPDRPPYINATFKGWKWMELWEKECAMFLGEGGKGKLCRCLGQMKREGGGKTGKWAFELKSLWEADWDDVAYVAGIVCA